MNSLLPRGLAALCLLAAAPCARAIVILQTDNRAQSITGTINGSSQSPLNTAPAAPFANYSGGQGAYGISTSQTSSVSTSLLTATGRAGNNFTAGSGITSLSSSGTSFFQIIFSVTNSTFFTLNTYQEFGHDGNVGISLIGPGTNIVYGTPVPSPTSHNVSGVLATGTYTFTASAASSLAVQSPPPFTQFGGYVLYDVSLALAPAVPDGGGTLALLAFALGVLGVVGIHRRR